MEKRGEGRKRNDTADRVGSDADKRELTQASYSHPQLPCRLTSFLAAPAQVRRSS